MNSDLAHVNQWLLANKQILMSSKPNLCSLAQPKNLVALLHSQRILSNDIPGPEAIKALG